MQRRVEQPHRDGQPVHGLQDLFEVGSLHLEQLEQRRPLLVGLVGQDHPAHDGKAVLLEEHVLGAAQADPLGAELAGPGGVGAGVGVGPHPETTGADLVGPPEHDAELAGDVALLEGQLAEEDGAVGAVERDPVALPDHRAVGGGHRVRPDREALGTDHRRLAPPTGDDGGVADETATGGEHALGDGDAVDVLGRGLLAHEDDPLAASCGGLGPIGIEVGVADGRAGRGGEPGGEQRRLHVAELGVQDLVEVLRPHPLHRLGPRDADGGILGEGHGDAQRGRAGALAHPGLEHPEPAALDGELAIEHVAVVAFQPFEDEGQLGVGGREDLGHGVERERGADAGHDVLALCVDQEVAVGPGGAGGRIPGEGDAGAGLLVAVAEHHRLDVDRCPEIVGDVLTAPIGLGPRRLPRPEDRFDGSPQLLSGVLGER